MAIAKNRVGFLGLATSLAVAAASLVIPACSSGGDGPAPYPTNGGTPERDASPPRPPTTGTAQPADAAPGVTGAVSSCSGKRPLAAGAPLTCAWLQSTDNCWARAVAKIESCGLVTAGTLTPDMKSCSAESGAAVTFAPPYPTVPLTRDAGFAYVMIGEDGGACYQVTATTPPPDGSSKPYLPHIALASADGCMSVDAEVDPGIVTITCPDGTGHSATQSLSGCDLPTYSFLAGTDAFGFQVTYGPNALGKSASAGLDVLQCAQ